MCYVRGAPGNYGRWAEATGDPRRSWARVLPWFLRSEDNSRGASDWHGSELRVRGVQGLRVVDALVMPTLPTGHTNAPAVMLVERASAQILGESGPGAGG